MSSALMLLTLLALGLLVGPATGALTLLVGYTGVGKSYVCNRHDGTVCETKDVCTMSSARSCTNTTYMGAHFIDSMGFGDNHPTPSPAPGTPPSLHPTLRAVKETLTTVNGTQVGGGLAHTRVLGRGGRGDARRGGGERGLGGG
jgi:hypothetical protein